MLSPRDNSSMPWVEQLPCRLSYLQCPENKKLIVKRGSQVEPRAPLTGNICAKFCTNRGAQTSGGALSRGYSKGWFLYLSL
jgi:hypothetical protein